MAFIDGDLRGERGDGADAMFERTLLESARADGPPDGATSDAWAKFAEVAGAAGRVAAAGGVVGVAGRFVRDGAGKWLLLGALVGGALTASWLGSGRGANVASSPVTSGSSSLSFASVPALRASEAAPRPAPSAGSPAVPSSSSRARMASGLAIVGRARQTLSLSASLSTLGAEIAALDAARNAIGAGAYDEALRVVEQYHRDFPAGELAPDADVLAMEALVAKGDHAEVARRAERFIGRYPRDPHLAHIRWLAGQ